MLIKYICSSEFFIYLTCIPFVVLLTLLNKLLIQARFSPLQMSWLWCYYISSDFRESRGEGGGEDGHSCWCCCGLICPSLPSFSLLPSHPKASSLGQSGRAAPVVAAPSEPVWLLQLWLVCGASWNCPSLSRLCSRRWPRSPAHEMVFENWRLAPRALKGRALARSPRVSAADSHPEAHWSVLSWMPSGRRLWLLEWWSERLIHVFWF